MMPAASRDGAKGSERRPRRHGDDAGGKKPADSVKNAEPWMFKSKLCSRWVATGDCSFADACWFAHGPVELRKPGLHVQAAFDNAGGEPDAARIKRSRRGGRNKRKGKAGGDPHSPGERTSGEDLETEDDAIDARVCHLSQDERDKLPASLSGRSSGEASEVASESDHALATGGGLRSTSASGDSTPGSTSGSLIAEAPALSAAPSWLLQPLEESAPLREELPHQQLGASCAANCPLLTCGSEPDISKLEACLADCSLAPPSAQGDLPSTLRDLAARAPSSTTNAAAHAAAVNAAAKQRMAPAAALNYPAGTPLYAQQRQPTPSGVSRSAHRVSASPHSIAVHSSQMGLSGSKLPQLPPPLINAPAAANESLTSSLPSPQHDGSHGGSVESFLSLQLQPQQGAAPAGQWSPPTVSRRPTSRSPTLSPLPAQPLSPVIPPPGLGQLLPLSPDSAAKLQQHAQQLQLQQLQQLQDRKSVV